MSHPQTTATRNDASLSPTLRSQRRLIEELLIEVTDHRISLDDETLTRPIRDYGITSLSVMTMLVKLERKVGAALSELGDGFAAPATFADLCELA